MARRWRWAEWLRIPVHSAPSLPFATCWAHDQSSGSDFTSQYAMVAVLLFGGSRPTIADPAAFVDEAGDVDRSPPGGRWQERHAPTRDRRHRDGGGAHPPRAGVRPRSPPQPPDPPPPP